MNGDSTTGRSVFLKYVAEDALRLADDLSGVELFSCAENVRAIALVALEERDREEAASAANRLLHSVRV